MACTAFGAQCERDTTERPYAPAKQPVVRVGVVTVPPLQVELWIHAQRTWMREFWNLLSPATVSMLNSD